MDFEKKKLDHQTFRNCENSMDDNAIQVGLPPMEEMNVVKRSKRISTMEKMLVYN